MTPTNAADRYAYRVVWSDADGEFVGLCAELPSLSWLARSPEEALRGILAAAREMVAEMQSSRDPVPEAIATRRYSGQFRVRIPPRLHRRLALEAAEENVSLNRLVSEKLGRE